MKEWLGEHSQVQAGVLSLDGEPNSHGDPKHQVGKVVGEAKMDKAGVPLLPLQITITLSISRVFSIWTLITLFIQEWALTSFSQFPVKEAIRINCCCTRRAVSQVKSSNWEITKESISFPVPKLRTCWRSRTKPRPKEWKFLPVSQVNSRKNCGNLYRLKIKMVAFS